MLYIWKRLYTSVFVIEVSAICAVEAVVPISIPSPGWTKRPKPSPRKADNKVKTTMLANTTKPIFPDPFPPSPAMAPATAVMTNTTTDIWIKLIKISPMNFKFVAHGPTTEPKIMPATVAMMIHRVCQVKCVSFFRYHKRRCVTSDCWL